MQTLHTITTPQYIITGILIWLIKVFISSYFIQPSTAKNLAKWKVLIIAVFFSPNILIWPINIVFDIYAFGMKYLSM